MQRAVFAACMACIVVLLTSALGGCAGIDSNNRVRAISVAPGVYMLQGAVGAADPGNLGRIGNAGFIVGDSGVIAIDTGTSYAHGRALLAAISQVTDKPIKLALITHVRPEFLFGGAAFRERGIPIRMHAKSARLMAARCETCLKTLRQTVGEAPMQGTVMFKPDQEFDDATHELTQIGRAVRVLHFGHSSGPGDIAVQDVQSGVIFAGGMADSGRIPDIQDSELEGWKRALESLRALRPTLLVPGHGPAQPAGEAIAGVQTYLRQLEERVRSMVTSGASLMNVGEAAELPTYERWDQYDTIHRRNASIAFLRIERELILKPEPAP
jgi:glyoxylase-like metal-dependent hydrolase (beta-lactamase superfamily II)